MDKENFIKIMKQKLKENKIDLTDKQIELFYLYLMTLNDWNTKINLTAIKNEKDIIVKHFIDSIAFKDKIEGNRIIDIGSGAGFPGIPLKILMPEKDITLIDSVNKKVMFMNNVIQLLDLKKIESLHVRAEDLAYDKNYREKYDIAVSRAVANMSTLVEYMLPFVKIGGKCICLKGPNCNNEIEDSKKAIKILGGKIEEIIPYQVEDNERFLVIIKKVLSTEQTYPRKQGKPLKEPIK